MTINYFHSLRLRQWFGAVFYFVWLYGFYYGAFMLNLTLLLVLMLFLVLFNIVITSLGEARTSLYASHSFVCFFGIFTRNNVVVTVLLTTSYDNDGYMPNKILQFDSRKKMMFSDTLFEFSSAYLNFGFL